MSRKFRKWLNYKDILVARNECRTYVFLINFLIKQVTVDIRLGKEGERTIPEVRFQNNLIVGTYIVYLGYLMTTIPSPCVRSDVT